MNRKLLTLIVVVSIACPAMGAKVKSFCEYGTGVALELSGEAGLWQQTWRGKAWEWWDCEAAPNVGFLSNNVVGLLQTWHTGPPDIDWTLMVVHIPLAGQLTLTAFGDMSSEDGAGQITGDFEGVFVADGLAAHAVVDEEAGTITIPFGAAVEPGPDGLIYVTETTGKFKSIQAVGPWEWHVNGTVTLARIEGMDLQLNILAALSTPALILGAREEIVLAGSYYRSSP